MVLVIAALKRKDAHGLAKNSSVYGSFCHAILQEKVSVGALWFRTIKCSNIVQSLRHHQDHAAAERFVLTVACEHTRRNDNQKCGREWIPTCWREMSSYPLTAVETRVIRSHRISSSLSYHRPAVSHSIPAAIHRSFI